MKFLELELKYKNIVRLKYQSKATQSTYINCFYRFKKDKKYWQNIPMSELEEYFIWFRDFHSISYHNQMLASLTIIYKILNQTQKLKNVSYLNQGRKLHKVLTVDQVQKSILATNNLKHKAIIHALYLSGCRISEFLNLELSDVNSSSMTIHIRSGKRGRDRYVPITEDLLFLLRTYYKQHKPSKYLFEGINGKYSKSSVSSILKHVGINNPHLLRHSIITHLIDSGEQMIKIQMFAGHSSPRSTQIYYNIAPNAIKLNHLPELKVA